jgi:hypothetical protein
MPGIGILLVAVDGDFVRTRLCIEDRGDAGQARNVFLDIPADLQLEKSVTVSGDHLLERHRQPIADIGTRIGSIERVQHADGMTRRDRSDRPQARQERPDIQPRQIGRNGGRLEAKDVGAHRVGKAQSARATDRIDQRAVDQSEPEGHHQRRQVARGARPFHLPGMGGMGGERRGIMRLGKVGVARNPQGGAQLLNVLAARNLGALVEPFRHHQVSGCANGLAAIHVDGGAHEHLGRLAHDHRAELERQPQPDRALEELDGPQCDGLGLRAHAEASRRPRT